MRVGLREAATWDSIEAATMATAQSCIRPGGGNWAHAKNAWEHIGDEPNSPLVYYQIWDETSPARLMGYIRLHRMTPLGMYSTWVVDYCLPFSYTAVAQAKERIMGSLLVKERIESPDYILSQSWPKLTLAFKEESARFSYKVQQPFPGVWMVVP